MSTAGSSPREPAIRRSELACPGSSPKMMANAVSVSQKVAARPMVIEALRTLDFGDTIRAFRPNGVTTRFFYRDLIEVVEAAGASVDVVVLAKVRTAADVLFADRLLTQIEETVGLPVGRIQLEVLIESAAAVLHAEAIAQSTPRLGGLIFGLLDLAGDIGAKETGAEQFFYHNYAKAKTVIAAKAAGITAVDGITQAIRDPEACRRDAEMASRMGFDGKWAIHPSQVEIINAAFTPTPEEIARAERILRAYEADAAAGRGALVVDDQMVDAVTLRVEERTLALARKAGLIP
jgi:citrate lyase subunit beta/citryl-CoA lyase